MKSVSVIALLGLAYVTNVQADQYDTLRTNWITQLTTTATNASTVASIASTAAKWQGQMVTSGTNYLFSDKPIGTSSPNIVNTYSRLQAMAQAYATPGCTNYQSAALGAAVAAGLDWMYSNAYNPNIAAYGVQPYGNWHDWEVSAPEGLINTALMIWPLLNSTEIANYCSAIDYFGPDGPLWIGEFDWPDLTGANTTDNVLVVMTRGILGKSATKLTEGQINLSGTTLLPGQSTAGAGQSVFLYYNNGEGFYSGDNAYVFHGNVAYTGHYGYVQLGSVIQIVDLVFGSPWQINDPNISNMFSWCTAGFEPLFYNGAMMDMVRGRFVGNSDESEFTAGSLILSYFQQVAGVAATNIAAALTNFVASPQPSPGQYNFYNMDRVVAQRGSGSNSWALGISMCSSRIANYENLTVTPSSESDLNGWNQGQGMTYLYVGSGDSNWTADYWPTVDVYHLVGTTAELNAPCLPNPTDQDWVGGVNVQDSNNNAVYGVAGMSLHPPASDTNETSQNPNGTPSTLYGLKSWFMFDDEVVCLGAGIGCNSTNEVDTTVENRRLGSSPTNNFWHGGVQQQPIIPWSNSISGATWCALDGVGGYYFPGGGSNLNAAFVSQSGTWTAIHPADTDTNIHSDNYLKLWINHGVGPANASYSYVLLPNFSSNAVASYAQNPDIAVLVNSTNVQAVKKAALGAVAANFWTTNGGSVDLITSDSQASVMTLQSYNTLSMGVSDPTQTNSGIITVTLAQSALSTISADTDVTVVQLSPNIVLQINVGNSQNGQPYHALFQTTPQQPTILSSGTASGAETLPFSYQITANYGPTNYAASGLPSGLNINTSTGLISGTPTQTGTFNTTISASNGAGTTKATLIITITPPPPVISSNLNLMGVVGVPLTYQVSASYAPASYSVSGLPAGLSMNPVTGLISGTPTQSGTFPVTISATNMGGTGTAVITITVGTTIANLTNSFVFSGSWVCPANVLSVQVQCWGAGGAGGSAQRTPNSGSVPYGGGGAGGTYAMVSNFPVTPGTTYTINVGAGGTNNSSTNGAQGAGGDSWISSSNNEPTNGCVAKGGAGGGSAIGNTSATANGTAGTGSSSGSIGDLVFAGGSGSAGSNSSKYAGAGGSSAGTNSAGTAAVSTSGGVAPSGGGNGGNGTTVTGIGNSGSAPGGGGGGARSGNGTQYAGGPGGSGKVLLSVQSLAIVSPATVTLGNTNQTYTGSAETVSVTVLPTNAMPISVTYSNQGYPVTTNPPTNAGSYWVLANINNTNYSGSTTATLTISPESATVSFANTSQPYNGYSRFVTINTTPSGLPTLVTYNGSSNIPKTVGNYSLIANIISTNYSGSGSSTFEIYDPVARWRSNFFGISSNTGSASASAQNGSGFDNNAAYAFGLNPTSPATAPLLSMSKGGSNIVSLSFNAIESGANPGYEGLTRYYNLEATTNLNDSNSWSPIVGYSNIIGSNQVVTFSTNTSGSSKWFFRLRAWLQ